MFQSNNYNRCVACTMPSDPPKIIDYSFPFKKSTHLPLTVKYYDKFLSKKICTDPLMMSIDHLVSPFQTRVGIMQNVLLRPFRHHEAENFRKFYRWTRQSGTENTQTFFRILHNSEKSESTSSRLHHLSEAHFQPDVPSH